MLKAGELIKNLILKNLHKTEDYSTLHFQNALIDYEINILPPPESNQNVTFKVGI